MPNTNKFLTPRAQCIHEIQCLILMDLRHLTLANPHDIAPYGMGTIGAIIAKYKEKLSPNLTEALIQESRWIYTYFTHCRHLAQPIDSLLVIKLVEMFEYFPY